MGDMEEVLLSNPEKHSKKALQKKLQSLEEVDNEAERSELSSYIIPVLGLLVITMVLLARHGVDNNQDTVGADWIRQFGLDQQRFLAQQYEAEQLHLSLGADETEVVVTWATMELADCTLYYAKLNPDNSPGPELKIAGELKTATIEADPAWAHVSNQKNRKLYSWRARIPDLIPGERYIYRVGTKVSDGTKMVTFHSKTYLYTARKLSDSRRRMNICIYGDLGLINDKSSRRLIQDVDNNKYDIIIHNGDFAYDLDTQLGGYGDQFMRKIEAITARVPYQTSVGNHEVKDNFTHYDVRFNMVNSGGVTRGQWNNFFYSFDVGPIHFVSFSTEFYYFLAYSGIEPLDSQWQWLKRDLEHATSEQERAKRPWIVVFGHRPMYCSSADGDDCSKDSNLLRKGLPGLGTYALEKLFYDYGVDVELYAHEHQYERFLPLYDGKVLNGTDNPDEPYLNPRAPVHIISGSAGCQERLDPFKGKPAVGSVTRLSDYGYTTLKASRCELQFEQISDDLGTVVDSFVVRKTRQNFPTESKSNIDCDMGEDEEIDCKSGWRNMWSCADEPEFLDNNPIGE